ncbi:unnamed protein product [Brassica oleracea var. botrytis]
MMLLSSNEKSYKILPLYRSYPSTSLYMRCFLVFY